MRNSPKKQDQDPAQAISSPSLSTITSRGIFVSHASEDADIATAFSELVQDVSSGVIPVYASTSKEDGIGIPYGEDWFTWIQNRMREASNVVALITSTSVGRPWILFEAGFGKASEGTNVFGLRIGLSAEEAYVGPFKAFQNSGSEPEDLQKLCKQLIEGTNLQPRDETVAMHISVFCDKVAKHLSSTKNGTQEKTTPESAAVFAALEEMKLMFREFRRPDAEDFAEREFTRIDRLLDFIMHGPTQLFDAGTRISLLLGVAIEAGYGWIAPMIEYSLNHQIDIKMLEMVIFESEEMMMRNKMRSRLGRHVLRILLESVIEYQEKEFGPKRTPRKSPTKE